MTGKLLCILSLSLLLLSGCGGHQEAASLPQEECGPESWTLADFPGCPEADPTVLREETVLLTEPKLTAVTLRGEGEGPSICLVAGVHGDERASWIAGNLLKDAHLAAGSLTIISPANPYGAEQDCRNTEDDRDLNRNFPGSPEGCDAQRVAYAITQQLRAAEPVLLLDLHEARPREGNRDALGNTLICQSLDGIGDLVWDLLLETEQGSLCGSPFSLYGSPPEGSLNRTSVLELGIPAITVETFREEELDRRVRNQLELVQYILQYYGMA